MGNEKGSKLKEKDKKKLRKKSLKNKAPTLVKMTKKKRGSLESQKKDAVRIGMRPAHLKKKNSMSVAPLREATRPPMQVEAEAEEIADTQLKPAKAKKKKGEAKNMKKKKAQEAKVQEAKDKEERRSPA